MKCPLCTAPVSDFVHHISWECTGNDTISGLELPPMIESYTSLALCRLLEERCPNLTSLLLPEAELTGVRDSNGLVNDHNQRLVDLLALINAPVPGRARRMLDWMRRLNPFNRGAERPSFIPPPMEPMEEEQWHRIPMDDEDVEDEGLMPGEEWTDDEYDDEEEDDHTGDEGEISTGRYPGLGDLLVSRLPRLAVFNNIEITPAIRAACTASTTAHFALPAPARRTVDPIPRPPSAISTAARGARLTESLLLRRPTVRSIAHRDLTSLPIHYTIGPPRQLEFSTFRPSEIAIGTETGNVCLLDTRSPRTSLVFRAGRDVPTAWSPALRPGETGRGMDTVFALSYCRQRRHANLLVATVACGRVNVFDTDVIRSHPGEYRPVTAIDVAIPPHATLGLLSAHHSVDDRWLVVNHDKGIEVRPFDRLETAAWRADDGDDDDVSRNVCKWMNQSTDTFVCTDVLHGRVTIHDIRSGPAPVSTIPQPFPVTAIPRPDDTELLISNSARRATLWDLRAGSARTNLRGVPQAPVRHQAPTRAYYGPTGDILMGCHDSPIIRWHGPDGHLKAEWCLPAALGIVTCRPAPFGGFGAAAITHGGHTEADLVVAEPGRGVVELVD